MKKRCNNLYMSLIIVVAAALLCLLPTQANAADEASQVLMLRKVFSAPVYSWADILKDNKKLIDNSFFERVEQRIRWSLDNGQVEDAVRFAYVGDLAGQAIDRKTDYRMQMSQLFRRLGNLSMALDLVSNILIFNPKDQEARFYRASLLQDGKDNLNSYPIYKELAEEGYKRSECYYRMALLELERQEFEAARDHLQQCLKIDGKHEPAKLALSRLETALASATFIPKQTEDGKSGAGIFSLPVSQGMPIAVSDTTKAQTLLKQADEARVNFEVTKAIELYQKALQFNPKLTDGYMYLGTLLFREGDIEEALKQLSSAASLAPDNGEIQRYLGYCYESRYDTGKSPADLKKAEDCFNKAKQLAPSNAFIDWDIKRLESKISGRA